MANTRARAKQVTFKSDATGGTVRNLHDKLSEAVSVRDFGAVGDGVTDDTAAVQSAIDSGKSVYWPDGVFTLVDGLTINQQDARYYGEAYGDNGSGIVCGTEGDWSIKCGATTASARLQFENLTIKGNNQKCWGIQFLDTGLFQRWDNVNFYNLRRARRHESIYYFTTESGVRYRDCIEGCTSVSAAADEVTMTGNTWHNTLYVYVYLDVASGSTFAEGETVTGGTSGDSAVIVAIETNRLVVRKAEGTSGTPSSITFEAAETLTGSVSGSSTISAVSIPTGLTIDSPTGSVCLIGCQNNNTKFYFNTCPNLNIIGGYYESYNHQHPVYELSNCTGFVTAGVLSGSITSIDDASYRGITGRIQSNSRFSSYPVITGGGNIFPVPTCDDASVLSAIGGTGSATINGNGYLEISGTTVSQYKEFALPASAEGVSTYIKIECLTGEVDVKLINTDNASDQIFVPADGVQIIRIAANQNAGTITVRIKGNSVASWSAEVTAWDVRPYSGIIGIPDFTDTSKVTISGTWTPVVMDNSLSPSEGQTYSTQSGTFVRIGNLVHCWGSITMTSLGTLTGTERTRLGGLPFAAANSNGPVQVTYGGGLAITSGANITGHTVSGTTYADMWEWNGTANPSAFSLNELSSDGSLNFHIVYTAS